MRTTLVLCLAICSFGVAAQASPLTEDQRLAFENIGRATAALQLCPSLEADHEGVARASISVGYNPRKVGVKGDPAYEVAVGTGRSALIVMRREPLDNVCSVALRNYGPDGELLAGLVRQKGVSARPKILAEAPATQRQTFPAPAASAQVEPSARVVAGIDLELAPRKFMGQRLEIRSARCLYADVNEFRCIPNDLATLVVFTDDINPEAEKARLMSQCATFADLTKDRCRVTIRFTPRKHDEDIVSGYQKRTIIFSDAVEVVARSERRRR